MKKTKRQRRYVRVDGMTAWELIEVLSRGKPDAQILVRQANVPTLDIHLVALVECTGDYVGPWVIEDGVAKLCVRMP